MQGAYKYPNCIFKCCILALVLLCSASLQAQSLSENQVKAGYVYNFLKYFSWERDNQIDTFKIGIYGDDLAFIEAILSIEKQKINDKPIRVVRFNTFDDISATQIFILTNDKKHFIKDILEMIRSNNTLLISDRCEYQRYVMLNFIYSDNSKISFEINSKNIEDANLKTSPKLVLLGGSEIDVRKLYIETEKSLVSEMEKTGLYEKELKIKKDELDISVKKLSVLQKDIVTLQNKIDSQKSELENLNYWTLVQQKAIDQKNSEINTQQEILSQRDKELNMRNSQISEKQKQIVEYTKVLNHQDNEINRRQIIIESQGKTVINQLTRIKTQQSVLYLLISLFTMALALAFVIYRSYQSNRRKKLQLEKINIELEKLSIVASQTDNAIAIMNADGKFEWVNEGFHRLYGFSLDELINIRGETLQQASDYKDIAETIEQIKIEKKSATYEAANITRDNNKIWINTTLTPILDEQQNIKKLILIDSNITQLKEAELAIMEKNEEIQRQSEELFEQAENLLTLNEELEFKKNKLEEALSKLKGTQSQLVESEKMVVLGQLTAGIAHEINNPINYINSGIDGLSMAFGNLLELINKYEKITPANLAIVLKDVEQFKKDIDYIELLKDIDMLARDIKSGVNRTIEIIRGLRTFSRVDESDYKAIDLHASIDSTLVILRNKYINRIEIVKKFGAIPEIECYPGKINQVLLNVIVNAIQAINGQGKITIRTQLRKRSGNEYVTLEIEDSGKGMAADVQKKIFEPFFTTKDVGEGTGLGLSISKSIIDSHMGSIEVESEPGKGSKFIINLPTVLEKKIKQIPILEKR